MAKDPTRPNPSPRGKKSSSIGPAIAFIVVLVFAAKGCNTNQPEPDITPVPPSQTERR